MINRTTSSADEEPDHDTVYQIPHWVGERMSLFCIEWSKAGRMFEIEGELLDRLTAEAKRRTGGS